MVWVCNTAVLGKLDYTSWFCWRPTYTLWRYNWPPFGSCLQCRHICTNPFWVCCYQAVKCGIWLEARMREHVAIVLTQIPLSFPRLSTPQSNCKSTAWYGSGRWVNFTFLMILVNTLKHTNWNCSVSVSTGRILTTELKGQSIGKSPGEALIPGYRLTVNCFQEQMDSANLKEMRWGRRTK